jgi:hypothetical protein
MIENACPFAPDASKPESMPRPVKRRESLIGKGSVKKIIMILCIVALTLLYAHSYPSPYWSGKSIWFQDWYIAKIGLYSYIIVMITFYFRLHRKIDKNTGNL